MREPIKSKYFIKRLNRSNDENDFIKLIYFPFLLCVQLIRAFTILF